MSVIGNKLRNVTLVCMSMGVLLFLYDGSPPLSSLDEYPVSDTDCSILVTSAISKDGDDQKRIQRLTTQTADILKTLGTKGPMALLLFDEHEGEFRCQPEVQFQRTLPKNLKPPRIVVDKLNHIHDQIGGTIIAETRGRMLEETATYILRALNKESNPKAPACQRQIIYYILPRSELESLAQDSSALWHGRLRTLCPTRYKVIVVVEDKNSVPQQLEDRVNGALNFHIRTPEEIKELLAIDTHFVLEDISKSVYHKEFPETFFYQRLAGWAVPSFLSTIPVLGSDNLNFNIFGSESIAIGSTKLEDLVITPQVTENNIKDADSRYTDIKYAIRKAYCEENARSIWVLTDGIQDTEGRTEDPEEADECSGVKAPSVKRWLFLQLLNPSAFDNPKVQDIERYARNLGFNVERIQFSPYNESLWQCPGWRTAPPELRWQTFGS
jgi:hypothetical protein